METINQLSPEELTALRVVYLRSPVRFLPVDLEIKEFLAACSDAALKQIAEGGIRTLSLSAIVACWARGVRLTTHHLPPPC